MKNKMKSTYFFVILASAVLLSFSWSATATEKNDDAASSKSSESMESDTSADAETINILEGKVIAISDCPEPSSIAYPNCNLTATIILNDLYHSKIVIIIPCIRDSKTVISPNIKLDSLVSFRRIKDEDVSEEEKTIQISDDNPDYDLEYCYADQVREISGYSKISVYKKKELEDIVYDPHLALTEKDVVTRKEYIDNELNRMNNIIANYSEKDAREFYDNFMEYTRDLGEKNHPYAEIQYEDGSKKIFPVEVNMPPKMFMDNAFSNDTDLMRHNAKIIASVNEFLKERGIILIVVPFPQHFEAFANKLGLSKQLSTYNINRVLFMKYLLEMDVEVLDIEPMIEKELASPFHFYSLLIKDLHPTNIGAYYLSQYIYDHLNIYDYPKTLEKNNYRNEPVRFKTKTVYYGEEFKEMDDLVLASNEDPISKDSPFLLVGDSFSMANILKYCLATQFKTKINMISATSSYHITARMLQMRTRDISPETKFCFLVDSSFELYHTFLPMVNTNITVFPDETRFPGRKFEKAGKDPQEEPSFEFDLDLSDLSLKSKKYKLFFSVSSTIAQSYSLVINSNNPVVISSHSSGHGVIEYPLSDISMPLHVVLSTKREAGFPTDQILTLSIDKIFLVEE